MAIQWKRNSPYNAGELTHVGEVCDYPVHREADVFATILDKAGNKHLIHVGINKLLWATVIIDNFPEDASRQVDPERFKQEFEWSRRQFENMFKIGLGRYVQARAGKTVPVGTIGIVRWVGEQPGGPRIEIEVEGEGRRWSKPEYFMAVPPDNFYEQWAERTERALAEGRELNLIDADFNKEDWFSELPYQPLSHSQAIEFFKEHDNQISPTPAEFTSILETL